MLEKERLIQDLIKDNLINRTSVIPAQAGI
jgi:hypothetical protein